MLGFFACPLNCEQPHFDSTWRDELTDNKDVCIGQETAVLIVGLALDNSGVIGLHLTED